MNILVTGTAGFIGFHVVNRLLTEGHTVVGIDSINEYYDVHLKFGRLAAAGIDKNKIQYGKPLKSATFESYTFYWLQLEDKEKLMFVFNKHQFEIVIHLAAQAGVRYSLENPDAYLNSNIISFLNVLEACRYHHIKHLVFASSSSVYGLNDHLPFSTSQNVDHPVSLYAASKKSNELMAHAYSHLFQLPVTGLRFFTVYGPWGRPDMALFIFTKNIVEGKPIPIFNNGYMQRDFTYVDDIVAGILKVMDNIPQPDKNWKASESDASSSSAPYKIYNIGNNAPVMLTEFVEAIENELGTKAKKEFLPLQPGDVPLTFADVSDLVRDTGYKPSTSVKEGIKDFITWYAKYYNVNSIM